MKTRLKVQRPEMKYCRFRRGLPDCDQDGITKIEHHHRHPRNEVDQVEMVVVVVLVVVAAKKEGGPKKGVPEEEEVAKAVQSPIGKASAWAHDEAEERSKDRSMVKVDGKESWNEFCLFWFGDRRE